MVNSQAMQDVVSTPSRIGKGRLSGFALGVRPEAPSLASCGFALLSSVGLILSFPDFNFWPLAWVGLVPLLAASVRNRPSQAFVLGWLFGSVFFFGSCYWLTYSMIHFGGIPSLIAYVLLVPGAVLLGIFPAIFMMIVSRAVERFGTQALLSAAFIWPSLEWARLEITGQLWNAIGYSQAYHPSLIQSARWGGVYATGFLIVLVNAIVAYACIRRIKRAWMTSAILLLLTAGLVVLAARSSKMNSSQTGSSTPELVVIAIQPNVPMEPVKDSALTQTLITRHTSLSTTALREWESTGRVDNVVGSPVDNWATDVSPTVRRDIPRLVIWPESPMNFAYGGDTELRESLANFAKTNNTSILLNSQEVAPNDGLYNSAMLINQDGNLIAQYDKIRLLPFGEYVPLPQWLPGAGLMRAIVGDFTPGSKYRVMQVGNVRAGVFICIESAYPALVRGFTNQGADVLINISNDGYLGPTAVMRQHLANAVFRAVENDRPLLSITNTGITALITTDGEVRNATAGFETNVRTWAIARGRETKTFYASQGDIFPAGCAVLSVAVFLFSFKRQSVEVHTT
ncbi:MAG: apolipoprotein N-acyltransferase [Pyrinomonadaceae bacterium]